MSWDDNISVEAKVRGLDPQLAAGETIIPCGTLRDHVKYATEEAKKKGVSAIVYLSDFERSKETKMLTTVLERLYIQELITLRDLKNNGMSRGEVIAVIQRLTGASFITAENHWYYCRNAKLFPKLKGHGALRTAQATTTKRSGVTTEKLLRWHATVDEALNELDSRNSWHDDWEGIKKSDKIDSFWGNMDETCMSAADGKLLLLSGCLCLPILLSNMN